MKAIYYSCLIFLASVSQSFSQAATLDSIFTSDGLILAHVKSVEPEYIKYSFPDEEVVISVYKNTIRRIRFKSGRSQIFSEALALNTLQSVYDFDQVSLTRLESETKGLVKLDEVFSKAVGTTTLSNINHVKERAFRKLKIQAALLGGNLIYMLDQNTVGNQYGSKYYPGKATETILSGIVYTNTLPKLNEVLAYIGSNHGFNSYLLAFIGNNNTDVVEGSTPPPIILDDIYEQNGFVYLKAKVRGIENQVFRVVFAEKEKIGIVWRDNDKIYNLYFNPNPQSSN